MQKFFKPTTTQKMTIFALWLINTQVFADTLPKTATTVIMQIHRAAIAADYATLQLLMTQDFIWSFGGDASAPQAIAEWKANPEALKHLIQVTSQPCIVHSDNTVECPRHAGLGYRAGFKHTNTGWRMYYFVQGD